MNQNSGDVSIMSKSIFNYTNSKMSLLQKASNPYGSNYSKPADLIR